jgi:cytochrome b561
LEKASKYSGIAVLLHWTVAILIIANVALAWSFDSVGDESKRFVYDTHKSIGITVLGFVLMRILWRLTHKPPAYPETFRSWERRLSYFAHFALYFLMLALPISGWLHDAAWEAAPQIPLQWFGLFEVGRLSAIMNLDPATKNQVHQQMAQFHEISGYALYALVFLHISGALKHQLLDKQPELQRMWR